MSKIEIEQIFKIIEERRNEAKKENKKPKSSIKEVMFLFNRHRNIVTKEEYEGIKDELNKLKEKYSKMGSAIREEIKERINEITFKEFMDYINEFKNISSIEGDKLNNDNNKDISFEELIKLYNKIKGIILLKGISTCYTIFSQGVITFIWSFNAYIYYGKEKIIETNELTDFIFKNVFLIGENEKYDNLEKNLTNKYSNIYISNFFYNNFKKINKEPMRKPISLLEKIISDVLKKKNIQDKSEIPLTNINEINIDSLNEFEKDCFKIILVPDIKELNNEIIIEKKIKKDFDLNRSDLEINIENRLFFYKGENLGKDEDLTTEYKNYNNLDSLNKNSKIFFILQKTICSFLNTKGGRLYIGIDDDFEVIGCYIRNLTEKNQIKNNLINLVSDFYPKVENNKIKVHFIPIKDYFSNKFIKNYYVIKIIVSQGNIHELYSICKDSYHSFLRLPGIVRELAVEDIKEEIIKRLSTEEKPVQPQEFEDIEPDDPNYNII